MTNGFGIPVIVSLGVSILRSVLETEKKVVIVLAKRPPDNVVNLEERRNRETS